MFSQPVAKYLANLFTLPFFGVYKVLNLTNWPAPDAVIYRRPHKSIYSESLQRVLNDVESAEIYNRSEVKLSKGEHPVRTFSA